ncbi:MAG TPA: HlyD family efflux transporter periplasmic adaptor subunit [Vicinamibacterales bacterium]|nr:HlyD family efflux transporter periplasmic adaptor subunit [Vicinamibacterales bacterium]
MKRRVVVAAVLIVLAAVAATYLKAGPALQERKTLVPTAKVVRGPLKLTVFAVGELRAGRTVNLMAPSVGGQIRVVKLLTTGTPVKKDDVVMEFDPSDQQFVLEQAQVDLESAEQQIVKMKADNAVQESQDKLNLLTAQYDLRKAELDVLSNEFVGAIDAQKNQLTLDEAKHHLQQLQQDAASRLATSAAALDVVAEKRNKADLAMKRSQGIIGSMVVKENRDGQMFYYSGMTLPEFREGDTTFSGRNVADVIEEGKMEAHAKITETDRDNLQQGQSARIQIDALPGRTFEAKVGELNGSASRGSFFETSAVRQFDIAIALDHPDPQMRAGSSLRVTIDGREVTNAVHVPRQAVFEKNGRNFAYLRNGDRFEQRDIKVENATESRAIVSGLNEGDVIALVDPDLALRRAKASNGPSSGVASK